MNPRFCFWSVCDGPYTAMMANCVQTARFAGVFKEFHILTDRVITHCECYDAYDFAKASGLFKLHYLKVGMERLNFEYFVWLDADTVFIRKPRDILSTLSRSPIHVPLDRNLSDLEEDFEWKGVSLFALRDLMRSAGVRDPVYLCQSAFWIIHHDVIKMVYDLAFGFWHDAREKGLTLDVAVALAYAMQIMCADPEKHQITNHLHIWASDDLGHFQHQLPSSLVGLASDHVARCAIMHLPNSKQLLTGRTG